MKKLFLAVVFTLLWFYPSYGQVNCTHYISPGGGGSGASQSSPMSNSAWWSAAQSSINSGGTPVGCLMDGTYTSISPPNGGANGVNGRPITLRALNDGMVLVTGNFSGQPLQVFNNGWLVFQGMDLCCSLFGGGGNGIGANVFQSHDIVFRRVAIYHGGDQNMIIWESQRITLEDVFLGGYAGSVAGNQDHETGHIFRRVVWWWDSMCPTGQPGALNQGATTNRTNATFAYLQYTTPQETAHMLYENNFFVWDARMHRGCSKGCGQDVPCDDAHAQYGSWSTGVYHRDTYNPSGVAPLNRFHNSITFGNVGNSWWPYPAGGLLTLQGNRGDDDTSTTLVDNSGSDTAGGLSNAAVYNATTGLCFQRVNDSLTQTPLWPWPMDSRIKKAISNMGLSPASPRVLNSHPPLGGAPGTGTQEYDSDTLTSYMVQRYGPIPSQCWGGNTTPPQPPPGSLIITQIPGPYPTTPIIDNVNRANGAPGANYTVMFGSGMVISGNQLVPTDSGFHMSRWNTQYGPDVEVYGTISTAIADNGQQIMAWRVQPTSNDRYSIGANSVTGTGNDTLSLTKWVGGVGTPLCPPDIPIGGDFQVNDRYGIRQRGSTIEVFYAPVGSTFSRLTTCDDTSIQGQGYIAFGGGGGGGGMDDLGAGTVQQFVPNAVARPAVSGCPGLGCPLTVGRPPIPQ